ncbi:protein of unknown function [Tenacibaculum sp. 190130A14a]|uniref:Uncharacterized protein n=2 Tax=Tenacibaculum polynesiense TaxID=3137857 RepID=A0ABP1F7D0_9FLAO
MRMSHWVKNLQLKRAKDNHILLDLFNSSWHLDTFQEKENKLILTVQRYPDRSIDHIFELDFDLNEVQYRNTERPLEKIQSLFY